MQFNSDVEAVDAFVEKYNLLRTEIAKVIVGQDEVVKNILISILLWKFKIRQVGR